MNTMVVEHTYNLFKRTEAILEKTDSNTTVYITIEMHFA